MECLNENVDPLQRGGRGVQKSEKLPYVIYERPLIVFIIFQNYEFMLVNLYSFRWEMKSFKIIPLSCVPMNISLPQKLARYQNFHYNL